MTLALSPILALAATAAANGDFDARHKQALAANPPGVELTVRVTPGTMAQGQPMTAVLQFRSGTPDRYELHAASYDRSGRMHHEDFHFDRVDGLADPLLDRFAGGMIGGGLSSSPLLGPEPHEISLDLAEWVRVDRPGRYRLYVTSHRVRDLDAAAKDKRAAGGVPVTSNVIEWVVTPTSAAECARQVETAAALVDSAPANRPVRDPNLDAGCRTLRFALCAEAIPQRVKRLGRQDACAYELMLGLYGAADRTAVVREMETWMTSPDAAVDDHFLDTLALLTQRARQPLPPPSPSFGRPSATERSDEEWEKERRGLSALGQAAERRLQAELPRKRGRARAVTALTLLSRADAAARPALRPLLADVLGELPADRLRGLLEHDWPLVRDPSLARPLQRLYGSPPGPPHTADELRTLALRRWYEMAPGEARTEILAEMQSLRPRLHPRWLALLPDEALPEIGDKLVSNMEALGELGGHADDHVLALLVARYATGRVKSRVAAVYDALPGEALCSRAPLLAYFFRLDPQDGEARLRALYREPRGPAACYDFLRRLAWLHWSAGVERVAVEHLDSGDLRRAIEAAEILGRHGSKEAAPALWARLEKWHREWKDRAALLEHDPRQRDEPPREGAHMGRALVRALATGAGWHTSAEAFDRLRSLCLTEECRGRVDVIRQQRKGPLSLWMDRNGGFRLADYELASMSALENKLEQLPRGTVLLWQPDRLMATLPDTVETRGKVAALATRHGLTLRDPTSPER